MKATSMAYFEMSKPKKYDQGVTSYPTNQKNTERLLENLKMISEG